VQQITCGFMIFVCHSFRNRSWTSMSNFLCFSKLKPALDTFFGHGPTNLLFFKIQCRTSLQWFYPYKLLKANVFFFFSFHISISDQLHLVFIIHIGEIVSRLFISVRKGNYYSILFRNKCGFETSKSSLIKVAPNPSR
jgi:hypothetical protein